VAALAQAHGVPVFLHGWSTNVLLAANLHFIAATSNAQWLEYTTQDSPLRWDLTQEQFRLVNSKVRVPQGPGLGITLNEEVVRRYRIF
jgi:L-alanine-DL-glutamate epimerase-like enolase superfamily enzyme